MSGGVSQGNSCAPPARLPKPENSGNVQALLLRADSRRSTAPNQSHNSDERLFTGAATAHPREETLAYFHIQSLTLIKSLSCLMAYD